MFQVCQRRGQTGSQLDGYQGEYCKYSHRPAGIPLTQHHQVHQSADFGREAQAAQVFNRLNMHSNLLHILKKNSDVNYYYRVSKTTPLTPILVENPHFRFKLWCLFIKKQS